VANLTAPHPESFEHFDSWLEHHSIPLSSVSMTYGGNTLIIESVPLTQANTLLGASYQLYRHIESSETILRTIGYALPAVLHKYVQTVAPTTSFFSPQTEWLHDLPGGWENSSSGEAASKLSRGLTVDSVTPTFLQWLYGTATYVTGAQDRNVLGTAGFANLYASSEDLTTFMFKYRPDAFDASFSIVPVNGGGNDPSNPHKEPNLNLQWAEAMSYPTRNTFYSVGRGPLGRDDWFLGWILYMINQPSVPQTVSATYGFDEDSISEDYARYACDLFAELGARGVSILISSGNHGVGVDCVAKGGFVQFRPKFPATCTYGICSRIGLCAQDAH
jgi:tripeptidyl-peptidase-1